MMRRLLCALLISIWMLPASASAAAMQRLAGSRISAFAAKVALEVAGGTDRRVEEIYAIPDMELPAGTVRLERGPRPTPSATYVAVPVIVDVDGRPVRTVYVGYRVTTYVAVPVAARDLPAGTVLAAGDLAMEKLPSQGRIPAATDELLGRRTLASVRAGTPLFPEMTAAVPLVQAGQPCLLILTDDGVRVTAEAISRQNGVLGQTVAVYVEQTGHAMSATVVAPGRVELDLGENGGQDVASGS